MKFSTTSTFTIQISTDGSKWNDTNSITVLSGTQIYVRLSDGTNCGVSYAAAMPLREGMVTYDANGGTGDVPDGTSAKHKQTVTVEFSSLPIRTGYTFLGWARINSATTAEYVEGVTPTFTMGDDDVTLYAVWEAIPGMNGDVANNPTKYYGATITNYSCTNDGACGWKIFHSDGDNIYLIADNYIDPKLYAPAGRSGTQISNSSILIDGTAAVLEPASDYNGAIDINEKVRKWIRWVDKYPSETRSSVKETAYLLDTDIWNKFSGKNSDYAIGAPTLELFVESYNKLHSEKIMVSAGWAYVVKWSTDSVYNLSISGLDTSESLYMCCDMWLASPHPQDGGTIYRVTKSGNIEGKGGCYAKGAFRPVVCLNSSVELESVSETEYKIK